MRALLHNTSTSECFEILDPDDYAAMMKDPAIEDVTGILDHERAWRQRAAAATARPLDPVKEYLARAVKHYDKTGARTGNPPWR